MFLQKYQYDISTRNLEEWKYNKKDNETATYEALREATTLPKFLITNFLNPSFLTLHTYIPSPQILEILSLSSPCPTLQGQQS